MFSLDNIYANVRRFRSNSGSRRHFSPLPTPPVTVQFSPVSYPSRPALRLGGALSVDVALPKPCRPLPDIIRRGNGDSQFVSGAPCSFVILTA